MRGEQQLLMPGQFLIDKGKVIEQGSPRQRGNRVIPEWIVHVARFWKAESRCRSIQQTLHSQLRGFY